MKLCIKVILKINVVCSLLVQSFRKKTDISKSVVKPSAIKWLDNVSDILPVEAIKEIFDAYPSV